MYYVVMKGDYSDRHIIAVTCDEQKAQKIKECYSDGYGSARIQEWEESNISFANYYHIEYNKTNDSYEIEKQSPEYAYEFNCIHEYYNNNGFEADIQAENKDVALKIARDLYAEYMAKNEGIV